MRIEVHSQPAGQGSKKHGGNGVMIESSVFVKPFREAIRWSIVEAARREGIAQLTGPIAAMMTFTMKKPKTFKKGRANVPVSAPDLDKLQRSAFDATTQSGIWEDDSRVVMVIARKVFPGTHEDALSSPGVVIRLEQFTGAIPEGWPL